MQKDYEDKDREEREAPPRFARTLGWRGVVGKLLFRPTRIKLSGCSLAVLVGWLLAGGWFTLYFSSQEEKLTLPPWYCHAPAIVLFLVGFTGREFRRRLVVSTGIEAPLAYQRDVPRDLTPVQSRKKRAFVYLTLALGVAMLASWQKHLVPLTPDELVEVLEAPAITPGIAFFFSVLARLFARVIWQQTTITVLGAVLAPFVLAQYVPWGRWLLKRTKVPNHFVAPLWALLIVSMLFWLIATYPFVI